MDQPADKTAPPLGLTTGEPGGLRPTDDPAQAASATKGPEMTKEPSDAAKPLPFGPSAPSTAERAGQPPKDHADASLPVQPCSPSTAGEPVGLRPTDDAARAPSVTDGPEMAKEPSDSAMPPYGAVRSLFAWGGLQSARARGRRSPAARAWPEPGGTGSQGRQQAPCRYY